MFRKILSFLTSLAFSLLLVLVLFLLVRALIPSRPPIVLEKMTIINAHEHMESMKEVAPYLRAMEENGVGRTVLLGSPEATMKPGTEGFSNEDRYNTVVLKIASSYPKRFIAFPTINVNNPKKLENLKRYINMGGQGLKLYSGHSRFHDLPLNDPSMEPIYSYCENRNIPILFHVNPGYYQEEFEAVLRSHPNLKVICPHFCLSSIATDRFQHLMDLYPNLYTDMSFGYPHFLKSALLRMSRDPEKYRKLIEKYQDRIFFGTDMVITSDPSKTSEWMSKVTRAYRDLLEKERYSFFAIEGMTLRGLKLDREILEKIYHHNFERFLASSGRSVSQDDAAPASTS